MKKLPGKSKSVLTGTFYLLKKRIEWFVGYFIKVHFTETIKEREGLWLCLIRLPVIVVYLFKLKVQDNYSVIAEILTQIDLNFFPVTD